jgi:GT2 family glycosyltransferase
MITNILITKGYERGYLPKKSSTVIQPLFATANFAIRREALVEIGQFDINCKTGEDVDLCIRLSRTKRELFFEPRAIIKHKHRTALLALLRQWYGYGRYHPYIFKKHNPKCLEIHYPTARGSHWSSRKFMKIFGLPFPIHASLFFTPFHIWHMFFALEIFCLLMKLYLVAMALFAGWFLRWVYLYRRPLINFNFRKIGLQLIYSFIGYLLNWAYVSGAFLGGLKLGVIYIEATRDKTPV